MLLHVVTCCYMLLHVVTCCYMLLHVVTCCYNAPLSANIIRYLYLFSVQKGVFEVFLMASI